MSVKGFVAGIILALLLVYVVDNYRHSRHLPGVLVSSEPYQRLIPTGSPWKENGVEFTPLADFHLRGRILHTESYWFDRGSSISPLDLAVGWGPMSDQAVLDEIHLYQGQRWYTWQPVRQRLPLPNDEIVSHSANIHVIPGSPEIKKKLVSLRVGDVAELDGYLVEAQAKDGGRWTSSLSRTDVGSGACELMWVRAVVVR